MELEELGSHNYNTHRTLRSLVSVNAWFSSNEEISDRLDFHAHVSFGEERLGNDDGKIVFRVAVKRCEIAFVLPGGQGVVIDPASVEMDKPLTPSTIEEVRKRSSKLGANVLLGIGSSLTKAEAALEGGAARQTETVARSERIESVYQERWKRTPDGHNAWEVKGAKEHGGRLNGPVFSAKERPRLSVVDRRGPTERDRAKFTNIEPVAYLQVRCRREDIDIYGIECSDDNSNLFSRLMSASSAKLMVAREILKEALVREGLAVGNIENNKFAEMTVCDVAITIIEGSA